ncbi:type I restriction endonuclease subunit R [Dehalococcoides mccartyi]|jgi:type I restriction enzyme R subunit|uniref:type I restriction endonuclease subunit R n=1 Tax=Dehalococcoides mccartyi TaxID=61435 RepID=UPI003D12F55A|nr:DEAD/DEAH box helicase family protein [Sphaerochaetaceae bacterium]
MPIRADQLQEKKDYQNLILEELRDRNGYVIRNAQTDWDADFAMDKELLFQFLNTTQPEKMEKLHKFYADKTEKTVINYINREITKDRSSLIYVLKNGVEFDNGVKLDIMYRRPATSFNEKLAWQYEQNILSVMEEVYHKEGERIDLVLFLNGIAIFAVELKCNTSGQNYENAINQYKHERDPHTRLFRFKAGVFAAFAMDLDEVYFCTSLRGVNSSFLPFNIGMPKSPDKPYSIGKGNPHNENGINVSYMWEQIWTKEKIILLIERFVFIEKKKEKNIETGRTKVKETVIFPRYHQLRAVERLVADIKVNRTSQNYLIEHSAGSGKTNTIAWLTHILASLHDTEDKNIFSNIIVITDRIIVDQQLQEAVMGIDHKTGLLKVLDDKCHSDDLAQALRGNTKIIVTTIHKFFYILEKNLLSLKDKTFAVLIDEAHSSTEGDLMRAVTHVLAGGKVEELPEETPEEEAGEELTTDEKIKVERAKAGKQPNVTMIAFTATPKPGTLQLFGTLNDEGKKTCFDLYSMRQAIEEGYILNVLDNYVTWQTYFKINKAIEDDPELQSITAKRKIARFVDLHDTNISQKIEIIIEHFRQNIADSLGGQAKAMVVTSSRPAAVKYKKEFEKYIERNGYTNIRALIAFSGKVTLDGETYTEAGMNGFSEETLRDEFDKSIYQVLLVANKYQTGFDQPKLVAMYVDKKLRGVSAVQTLSRLNRIFRPYDKRTFILDFKNKAEDILKAFAPFYEETELFDTISPSDIRRLEEEIEFYNILTENDIIEFNDLLYLPKRTAKQKQRMWALLDNAAREVRKKNTEEQFAIRTTIRRFLKSYCFLIQATCYENVELHKRYNYLSYLVKELDIKGGNDFDIADKITVSGFEQKQTGVMANPEVESKPELKMKTPKPAQPEAEQLKMLSVIIEEINTIYGSKGDTGVRTKAAMQIRDILLKDARLRASAKNNPFSDFKFTYKDSVSDALVAGYDENVDFYTLLLGNEELRDKITEVYMKEVYESLRGGK